MSGQIPTYKPKIQVLLTKVIKPRGETTERYLAPNNQIDLTDYLGADGSVVTWKDITQPLGTFSISFPDQAGKRSLDSLYASMCPMDHIEIRMARDAWQHAGKSAKLPIVMRGFITRVQREQRMSEDGRPVRYVVVQGQDYGKLLSILQIFYARNYGLGQNLLTTFKLSENYPVVYKSYPASEFVRTVVNAIVNPRLKELWQASALAGTIFKHFQIEVDASVPDGVVQPYVFQTFQGTLWELLREFANLYWNELFIQDRDDGTYMVYRPLPYKDIKGRFIAPGAEPGTIVITEDDVQAIDVVRTDQDVGNFYWAEAPAYQLVGASLMQDYSHFNKDEYLQENYANDDPRLYGIRKLAAKSWQGPTDEKTSGRKVKAMDTEKSVRLMFDWLKYLRARLKSYNKDNVLFESGEMVLKGNEKIRPGTYLTIDHPGAFRADYYLQAVTQTFIPFQEFTTRVRFVRGTGFIERTKL